MLLTYTKEYIQFCYVSLGSCSELETLSIIASTEGYINPEELSALSEMLNHETKMLSSLISKLKDS